MGQSRWSMSFPFSRRRTFSRLSASSRAAKSPAGPPPTIMTSNFSIFSRPFPGHHIAHLFIGGYFPGHLLLEDEASHIHRGPPQPVIYPLLDHGSQAGIVVVKEARLKDSPFRRDPRQLFAHKIGAAAGGAAEHLGPLDGPALRVYLE